MEFTMCRFPSSLLAAIALTLTASGCLVGDPRSTELLRPSMTAVAEPIGPFSYGPDPSQTLAVYRPTRWAATDRRPVIVYVHGGAWMTGTRTALLPVIKAQVRRGWVVVSIDYRLARWVEDPTAPGGQRAVNTFPAQIYDVDRAIRWTRANAATLGVDPAKLVVAGHSAGAHLALLAGLASDRWVDPTLPHELKAVPAKPQGVVSLSAPTDLTQLKFTVLGITSNYILNMLMGCDYLPPATTAAPCRGGAAPSGETLTSMSPTSYASANDPPVYLAQGDRDSLLYPAVSSRTPAWMAQTMHTALARAGNDLRTWLDVVDRSLVNGLRMALPMSAREHDVSYGIALVMFEHFLEQVAAGTL